jgi:hypothetical protein
MPVEMEGCEDIHLKLHATIEFLTAELPPFDKQRYMQAAYRNKYVNVSRVRHWVQQFKQEEVGEESLCNKPS